MKVKAHKVVIWKCGSLKVRDERKQILYTRIYPVVRLGIKPLLHPRCWSTHKEYCFPATKSLPGTPSSRSPWSHFPLRSFSTKNGGLHVPRTNMSMSLYTKPEGRRRAGKPPRLQGWPAHRVQVMVHSKTTAQGTTTLLTHSLRSYLSTISH